MPAGNVAGRWYTLVETGCFFTEHCDMKIFQKAITLQHKKRGFHLITSEITRAIGTASGIQQGICHVFIKHTSASLTINENADPTVRKDFEMFFNKTVKEHDLDYVHDT